MTTATATACDFVRRAGQELAAGRARAIAAQRDDAECGICGDAYPARHLLDPTASSDLQVCVSCCFDGDLLPRALPENLIYRLDRLFFEDLALPAGASAVAALLACAAGPGLTSRLQRPGVGSPRCRCRTGTIPACCGSGFPRPGARRP